MTAKWFSLAEPTDGMPQPFVTVAALHEAKWVNAIWSGTTWFAGGKTVDVTQWKPHLAGTRDLAAKAA